jgi:hypothetical protein
MLSLLNVSSISIYKSARFFSHSLGLMTLEEFDAQQIFCVFGSFFFSKTHPPFFFSERRHKKKKEESLNTIRSRSTEIKGHNSISPRNGGR